jgi:hypothetical protein
LEGALTIDAGGPVEGRLVPHLVPFGCSILIGRRQTRVESAKVNGRYLRNALGEPINYVREEYPYWLESTPRRPVFTTELVVDL